jgi:hypothetical protein
MREYDEAAIPIGWHVNQVGASPERPLVASGLVDSERGLPNEKQNEARQGEDAEASCYWNLPGPSFHSTIMHDFLLGTSNALGLKLEIHKPRSYFRVPGDRAGRGAIGQTHIRHPLR